MLMITIILIHDGLSFLNFLISVQKLINSRDMCERKSMKLF